LPSISFLKYAVDALGKKHVVVSLDIKGEKLLGRFELGNPLTVLREIQKLGVDQVIVLDLARVGSGEGVNMPLLKDMLKTQLTLFVGGGVRDTADLLALKNVGVFGVLVATALHSGKITLTELNQADLLL
jgi:phosphoribosylformimino-5-aminoimidazole carboxamide ribotide isomerase